MRGILAHFIIDTPYIHLVQEFTQVYIEASHFELLPLFLFEIVEGSIARDSQRPTLIDKLKATNGGQRQAQEAQLPGHCCR